MRVDTVSAVAYDWLENDPNHGVHKNGQSGKELGEAISR